MKDRRIHLALAVGIGLGYLLRTSFARAAAPVSVRVPVGARRAVMPVRPRLPVAAGNDGGQGIGTLPPRPRLTVSHPPAQSPKSRAKKPGRCNVELINDDYTSMDFVVEMLRKHFNRTAEDAQSLMMRVHTKGSAIANAQPLQIEVAETKQFIVMDEAKKREMPFRAEIVRL